MFQSITNLKYPGSVLYWSLNIKTEDSTLHINIIQAEQLTSSLNEPT